MNVHEKTIGVVGAGNMGAGIAQKYASAGFQTIVVDISEEGLQRGRTSIESTLDQGVERKLFTEALKNEILGRLDFTTDTSSLKDAALIVEAIFENKDVKQKLFRELGELCGKDTILATNTSSFCVDDVANGVRFPERVLGLHYFYHPAKNKLVEVIKGTKTSDESFKKAWALQEASGKIAIESADAPGFIVNRFFVPWLNEAMRVVEEGIANIATVELAAKKAFRVGMGPFELMNVTGVPITLHAATTLGNELGKFYAPCDLIRPVVDAKSTWQFDGDVDETCIEAIGKRLWSVIDSIATQIVFEEKVCSLEDCDLGARVGLRWPQGPFESMNARGVRQAFAAAQLLHDRTPSLPPLSNDFKSHADNDQNFRLQVVTQRVDEQGVGWITFNRPDAMNALSEDVMAQLGECFHSLSQNNACKGIVIQGRGKAFVAGADIRYFVSKIEADCVDDIVEYASGGQELFKTIDASPKTVVCKLDGLSLGGGSELALACDYIVGDARATLGFPETGIGIYPGLGGTQRCARRVGVPLARWLVLTGQVVKGKHALSLGLLDELCESKDLDVRCVEFALNEKPVIRENVPQHSISGYEELESIFSMSASEITNAVIDDSISDKRVEKAITKLQSKAPIALEFADKLVSGSETWTLAEGLSEESKGMKAIFSTEDALEGMRSLGRGRPKFLGR